MDKRRAKEIASSPVMANVTYNGNPIYIDGVSENKETANIHYLNQSSGVQEVSLNNLVEHL
jgi:small acid-soluble spore protein H (minor)